MRTEYRISLTEDDEETSLDVLEWTANFPRCAGHYWALSKKCEAVEVVFVDTEKGERSSVYIVGDDCIYALDDFSHWLGPLPQPGSPQ
jgi:hypothetical protein